MLTKEEKGLLVQVFGAAMRAALQEIADLGDRAMRKVPTDPLALGKATDVHLLGDAKSEWAMVQVLHEFGRLNHFRFHVFGEEVGNMTVGDLRSHKVITTTLDGIDGTSVFAEHKPAGPMLAGLYGENPSYDDVFVAAVGDTTRGQFVLACDDFRHLVALDNAPPVGLKKFGDVLPDEGKIVCDTYTEAAKRTFKHEQVTPHGGSTAAVAFAMCTGKGDPRIIGLLDATRKQNLEQPTMYGLMKFFGGVYETADDGVPVGIQYYLDWAMDPDPEALSQVPLIIAASSEVAQYCASNYLKHLVA